VSHTTHAAPAEFKNDQVHVVVLQRPGCRVELKVKAASPLIQAARREAVKAVGKEVLIPGFRKGRAPDEMILKKYPKEIEKETHNKLADASFAEAQKLAKVPLLNNNARVTFDLQKMDNREAELVFSFETEPAIPVIDPKQFEPKPVERVQIGEKEIEEAIRQMQFFFAQWKPVMDRPVQEKDYVMIDLDTIEGETAQRVFNQVRFEISHERMAKWMQDLVIGAKVGDVLEGISEPDANATEEEKKEFAPKKVRISILKLEEATLPELNDEFAKKVGASDVAHMRQSVTDMLNRQADEKVRDTLREQVNEFLIKQYPFEIPHSLIQTEMEHRQRQLLQNPNFKREWDNMPQNEKKSFEIKMAAESTHAVQLFYLSRQVVRNTNIGITHKEVQDEAIATLRAHGVQQQIALDQIPKEVYALALSKIILARAQDYIIAARASNP
jgi:trigger factor